MGEYKRYLAGVCRLCEGKINSKYTIYKVKEFQHDVKLAFGIDVTTDEPDVHPPNLDDSCRGKLRRWRKKKNNAKEKTPIQMNVVQWHLRHPSIVEKTPAEAATEAAN